MDKVLLVEDDALSAGTLALALRQAGFDAVPAPNEASAIELAESADYSAAIIDVSLTHSMRGGVPTFGQEGIRVVAAVRHHNPGAYIIAHSFLLDDPDHEADVRRKLDEAGADDVVHRPDLDVAPASLRATLEKGKEKALTRISLRRKLTFGADLRSQAIKEIVREDSMHRLIEQMLPDAASVHVTGLAGGRSDAVVMRLESPTSEPGRQRTHGVLKLNRSGHALNAEVRGNPPAGSEWSQQSAGIVWHSRAPIDGWYVMLQQEIRNARTLETWLYEPATGTLAADTNLVSTIVESFVVGPITSANAVPTAGAPSAFLTYRAAAEIEAQLRDLTIIARALGRTEATAVRDVERFVSTGVGSWNFGRHASVFIHLHGDLHTRNILIDGRNHVRTIDFARANVLPRLTDTANLVVDIWIKFIGGVGIKQHAMTSVEKWRKWICQREPWVAIRRRPRKSRRRAARHALLLQGIGNAFDASLSPAPSPIEFADALVFQLLRYVRFDIPLPKKILAVRLVSEIVREFGFV